MTRTFEIEFHGKRCFSCGRYYYIEDQIKALAGCPICLSSELDKERAKIELLQKQTRGYKNYIAGLKKKGSE